MNSRTKILPIAAVFFMALGVLIFVFSMSLNGWDFGKLSTIEYETNEYEITDEFNSISMNTDTADIIFAISDDGKSKVVCYEEEPEKHYVIVKDGVLSVKVLKTKKWYEYISINFESPKITVFLAENQYSSLFIKERTGDIEIAKELSFESIDVSVSTGDVKNYASASGLVKISSSTGDIFTENITAGGMELSVSTGRVRVHGVKCVGSFSVKVDTGKSELADIECKKLLSTGNTGDIIMKNVIVAENISIERDTGDVELDGCDAGELWIKTDTGDVEGALLSDKIFIIETDTGIKDVPKTTSGGKCEIITDTGDIKIKIK